MKKHLLISGLMLLVSSFSFGQTFQQQSDNTGFETNCDLASETSLYEWALYGPSGGGGTDDTKIDTLILGWGTGSGDMYVIFQLDGHDLDLSNTSNQIMSVALRSIDATSGASLPLTYTLKLQDASNNDLIDGSITFAVNGTAQLFSGNFSGHILAGKDLTAVHKVIFYYPGPGGVAGAKLLASNFKVGNTSFTTGTQSAQSMVSEANLYPNPTSGATYLELNLNTNANVKVVLNDMLGKEMKVITEQTTSSLKESFDVSGLNKGIYSVVYMIDGAVAKTQKLVIN